jgi:hypothetical protein
LTALGAAVLAAVALLAPAAGRADEPPEATRLTRGDVTTWAYVLAPAGARREPSASSPLATIVKPATPSGESNLVVALESRPDAYGREWVRIRLAILPNNSTGWVRRIALGEFHVVRTRLVVDRATFRAVLWRHGRAVFTARIGVGEPHWPTPKGEFYVRERLSGFGDPFYGPVAFGTSARSRVLTDWPGGGYIGIHGTDRPDLLPGRVSHGCIRMRNADILRLARLMPPGTPLTIR